MAATKSPRRIPSAASPMLCVPVEQAVTTHMFGPLMPSSIAIWPDAVSGSMLAMKKGLTDFAPFVASVQADPHFLTSRVPVGNGEFLATRLA